MSESNPIESNKPPKRPYRWLRRILRTLAGIFIVLILLLLFIRSPWGQGIIKDKLVNYVSDKTNTEVNLEKLFVTFEGNVQVEGLYLEDKKGDTLVYSKSLEANIPLWKTISGKAYGVDQLRWEGLTANIIRKDSISGFNFQFLIDAFASQDDTQVEPKTEDPFNLVIGNLNLKDLNIKYFDMVTGIDSDFKIGTLNADVEKTDLEEMIFDVENIQLSDTDIKFYQQSTGKSEGNSETTLPKISVGKISLIEVNTDFKSESLSAKLDLEEFYTEIPNLDIANQEYNVSTIQLKNSEVDINLFSEDTSNTSESEKRGNSKVFEWPDLKVEVAKIDLENNKIKYSVNSEKPGKTQLNPNALSFQDLNLNANAIVIEKNDLELVINSFSFIEYSGYNLKTFQGDFKFTDQQFYAQDLILVLNDNNLKGFAELSYKSIQDLIDSPESTTFNTRLSSFNFSLKELFKFQPELKQNPYLGALSRKDFYGRLRADGMVSNINIPDFKLNWGKSTQISAIGTVQNATELKAIQIALPNFNFKSNQKDIANFLDQEELGVNLPESFVLKGNLNGSLSDVSTQLFLNSTQGEIELKGNLSNNNEFKFDSNLKIVDYRIDELLKNDQLGHLNLELSSNGSGQTIEDITSNLDAVIHEFSYNDYNFKDLKIEGSIDKGKGSFVSNYKDDNLNLKLETTVELDSLRTKANINLDLIGADLKALGLVQRNIKTAFNLNLELNQENEILTLDTNVKEGIVVYEDKSYLIGSVNTSAYISKDTTMIDFKNKIMDLSLKSNASPERFSESINNHIKSYFYEVEKQKTLPRGQADTLNKPVKVKVNGRIAQSPLLINVFLVNLKDLDTVNLALDFDEKSRKLKANITAPRINYSGNEIDSLMFNLNTDAQSLKFDFGFNSIKSGPFNVPKTSFSGNQIDNELFLKFEATKDNNHLIYASSKLSSDENRLKYHINTDSLIINSKSWEIPEDNAVFFANDTLQFNNFKINRNGQSIEITDKVTQQNNSQVAFDFKNFKLSQFLNYLNPDTEVAKGKIDGKLVIENLFTNAGILADMSVSELEVLQANFGTLSLNANSNDIGNYVFEASLKEGDLDLDFNGSYNTTEESQQIDMELYINEYKLNTLENLTLGEVKNGSGTISGQFKIDGMLSQPNYSGQLNFNNADFLITKLNTNFNFRNEVLNIDNSGLSMSDFTIRDATGNQLVVSGEITTESFVNPKFNLNLKANDFKILDAQAEDNDLFYGTAIFDADVKLTGDLQIPKLDAKLEVDSKTDFVYILPSNTASIEKRDGVVTFVNRENPDAILTKDKPQTASITGFDISSFIKISEKAKFKIIIDNSSGDNFQTQGKGELNLRMLPNGTINLSGFYEASEGSYKLSLYNLVKREFSLVPGSRVTWIGDPFNAKLDVTALYNVKASVSSLLADQISGMDPTLRSKYNQVLPFEVYLNIDGELFQPEISFELDMPEDEKDALSGEVYGRIKQVNQREEELNQQVFSLLVLNRFYPSQGSDGSSGGIESLAQQNLNDAISGQLNTLSEKILGNSGVELNFGLDSYTNYQVDSPSQTTQLNVAAQKKLLNDRLTVRVGSDINIDRGNTVGEATPIVGNVSVIYELTKDGRYKIKGFRKNRFENIIDGQTIVSGIALIFTQEFNKFDELWRALIKKQKSENKTEEEETDNNTKSSEDKTDKENNNENE